MEEDIFMYMFMLGCAIALTVATLVSYFGYL